MSNCDIVRTFDLGDHVSSESGDSSEVFVVTGYEVSDGINACGRPPRKYRGWFYHIRSLGDGVEFIVPESQLQLVSVPTKKAAEVKLCPNCGGKL